MPRSKGFYIGLMFDRAARRHAAAPVVLDTPLQLSPQDGTTVTVGRLAELVRELAGRLVTAGVRPGDRVAVYKTNNFDIALLAAASSGPTRSPRCSHRCSPARRSVGCWNAWTRRGC